MSVTSDPSSPVNHLSTVTVTCTVELNSAILVSEVSMLLVSAQLSHPNGTMLSLSNSTTGITFTYTAQLNSFQRNDSGNYSCSATIEPQQTATFVSGSDSVTRTAEITIGMLYNYGGNNSASYNYSILQLQVCISHLEVRPMVMMTTF